MIKLNLNTGRRYDGYGEQVVDKQTICLTNEEAAEWLTKLIEEKGVEYTKTWLLFAKEGIDTSTNKNLGRTHTDTVKKIRKEIR